MKSKNNYNSLINIKKNFDSRLKKYINRYSTTINLKNINENNYYDVLSNYCSLFSSSICDTELKATFLNYSFSIINKIGKKSILDINKRIEESVSYISNNFGYIISCYDKNGILNTQNKNYYLNLFKNKGFNK